MPDITPDYSNDPAKWHNDFAAQKAAREPFPCPKGEQTARNWLWSPRKWDHERDIFKDCGPHFRDVPKSTYTPPARWIYSDGSPRTEAACR